MQHSDCRLGEICEQNGTNLRSLLGGSVIKIIYRNGKNVNRISLRRDGWVTTGTTLHLKNILCHKKIKILVSLIKLRALLFFSKGLINIYKSSLATSFNIVQTSSSVNLNLNNFIKEMHRSMLKTCIFTNLETYFQYVDENIKHSIESCSLFFLDPSQVIDEV